MVSEDRQKIIETNRSLRLIKNELESLLEKGVINDEAFEQIHSLLPAESSFSAAAGGRSATATPAARNPLPTPAATPVATALGNLSLNPPSYQSTTAQPPALPQRNQPVPPPTKPILAHARALYKYSAADSRDCSFDKDDRIAIHEYINADWWLGRNTRTGQEGIFPKSYVLVEQDNAKTAAPAVLYPHQPAYNSGYPGAPPPGNPYNAPVPPQAVAEQPHQPQQQEEGGSKMGEHGKKFGKKLGNAAIFGAGATIGSNIVNSIF
ncbi:SH3 domain-containing protein [Podospora australis]|uniref:SH3 domain-containing protein n=1 Tax=Podospora australis TaxID=1536484 RepID=A0AAN7AHX9_9PEZI|nr:SH3 domain-containing protein [Podospora australis]